jgi:hypothetical protein
MNRRSFITSVIGMMAIAASPPLLLAVTESYNLPPKGSIFRELLDGYHEQFGIYPAPDTLEYVFLKTRADQLEDYQQNIFELLKGSPKVPCTNDPWWDISDAGKPYSMRFKLES